MTLYRRYLENQTPLPLMLQPPEGINQMSIDSAGNFICGGGSWRTIPVWTDNPQGLCQASQAAVQQQQQPAAGEQKMAMASPAGSGYVRPVIATGASAPVKIFFVIKPVTLVAGFLFSARFISLLTAWLSA